MESDARRARAEVGRVPICVSALRQHRMRQAERRLACGMSWQNHDLVFASALGTPLDGPSISRRFVKPVAAAGVPRIPFHGLRHTHATLLMKTGVHPKVASERLGHASIMPTLQTYSHVLPQMQQEAATIFAEVVGADGGERVGDSRIEGACDSIVENPADSLVESTGERADSGEAAGA